MSNEFSGTSIFYTPASGDDFVLPTTKEAGDYIPVDPKFLRVNTAGELNLYLFFPSRKRFVLFKAAGTPIREDQIEMLTKTGRRPVFIPRTQILELNQYLSSDLIHLVGDPKLELEEKVHKLHTIALMVLQNLFENPPDNETFLATAKNVSDALSALVIQEPYAAYCLHLLRSYDYSTYSHSLNVAALGLGLFQELQMETNTNRILDFSQGFLLHDIGKCDIPREIIQKQGPLTDLEWEILKSHSTKGYHRLSEDPLLSEDARLVALYHHEAFDGSGYPIGLEKNSIPLNSRICKVIDVFDALTSQRCYKGAITPFQALKFMGEEMKEKFDQELRIQFIVFLEKMGKVASHYTDSPLTLK